MRAALLAGIALAALSAAQVPPAERIDFPAGGTLHLKDSRGELTVTGWDQPQIEITVFKTSDRVAVTTERRGNEVLIATTGPRQGTVECRIQAPRNARVLIDHRSGDVHLEGLLGEIHATNRRGLITVRLPEQARLNVDARSRLGSIESDFAGAEHRKLKFGHTFIEPASPGAQQLYLRIGFGDIFLLKSATPLPGPLTGQASPTPQS